MLLAVAAIACAPRAAQAADLSQPKYKVVVDKDVRIPTRDGSHLVADVFRPDASGEKFPEPDWWVPRDYILIFVDSRGTGKSPGDTDVRGMQETLDYYDAIEWAARQGWSTGKIGLAGVSYYAVTQWNVASLQPPHLTTMIPWAGYGSITRACSRSETPW